MERKPAAEQLHAIANAAEPEASVATGRLEDLLRVEADAEILHRQEDAGRRRDRADLDRARPRMLGTVRHRLLDDSKDERFEVRIEPSVHSVVLELDMDRRALLEAPEEPHVGGEQA